MPERGPRRIDRARRAADRALWAAYSHVYDGLLAFWPYRNLLQQVADELALDDASALLDVGCGTGNLLVTALDRRDMRAVGVDASASMLQQAKTKLATASGVELFECDALTYLERSPAAAFDRVAAVNVLYAVEDRSRFWREVVRVLEPGGIAVVTTSTRGGSTSIIREHLDHASWHSLLRPKLVAVFLVDALISVLARANHFAFPSDDTLIREAEAGGATVVRSTRTYGGVNVLLTVAPRRRTHDTASHDDGEGPST